VLEDTVPKLFFTWN